MEKSKSVKNFANRLRSLRVYAGLSQEEFARELGISKGAVSYYESGQRVPDIVVLSAFAGYFEVSTDYLLGRSNAPSEKDYEADINAILNLISKTNTDIARLLVKHGELASALHINK